MAYIPSYHHVKNKSYPNLRIARPRVFIPAFPGTNGETDACWAFARAGALPEEFVITNSSAADIQNCLLRMEERLRQAQIIMLPGGFSAGDEPDGSGKFIANWFRNPRMTEAVRDLLRRDGLILGFCNGFQALVKLGLLPGGDICELRPCSPTLTFNTIGRHISCLAPTKIISNKSPWLWLTEPGDRHMIPVSHGEGRFWAGEEVLRTLADNGQIASQYVDEQGEPTYDIRCNPNGSLWAIEGVTSPDGRILGKMGHSERTGAGLLQNVPGNKDQRIFEAGVRYFQ